MKEVHLRASIICMLISLIFSLVSLFVWTSDCLTHGTKIICFLFMTVFLFICINMAISNYIKAFLTKNYRLFPAKYQVSSSNTNFSANYNLNKDDRIIISDSEVLENDVIRKNAEIFNILDNIVKSAVDEAQEFYLRLSKTNSCRDAECEIVKVLEEDETVESALILEYDFNLGEYRCIISKNGILTNNLKTDCFTQEQLGKLKDFIKNNINDLKGVKKLDNFIFTAFEERIDLYKIICIKLNDNIGIMGNFSLDLYTLDKVRSLSIKLLNVKLVYKNLCYLEALADNYIYWEDESCGNRRIVDFPLWFSKLYFRFKEKVQKELSTELHDEIKQQIYALKVRMGSESVICQNTSQLLNSIESWKEQIDEIIYSFREVCFELFPVIVVEKDLVYLIKKLIERLHIQYPINIVFNHTAKTFDLPVETKLNIYRIVQELLTNAVKHAQAENVELELLLKNESLIFRYFDDGIGINCERCIDKSNHFGLQYMRERVRMLYGNMTVRTEPGFGLYVQLEIPFVA